MSLLEQINKKDFDRVVSYSQDIPAPQTTELLNKWSVAKRDIAIKFLKGKTHYTHPDKVRFELNTEAKEERLNHFEEYIVNLFDNYSHPLARFLRNLSTEEFYANSLLNDYTILEKDDKKIPSGSKVVKSFKYFIDDIKLLADLQNKASAIIQENKVEGYLTFSIHPLDFLSSSENTYNWRSCHSLDGEYRAGNLSYMGDRGTMMVYLSGEEKVKLPHFPEDVPWNSKKWRMLLHFDENFEVCFAGRQYPFFSPGALEKIFEVFSQYINPYETNMWGVVQNPWSPWCNDYIEKYVNQATGREVFFDEGQYYVINGCICNKYNLVKDAPNSLHFNDITRSSCYTRPYYMFKSYYQCSPKEFMIGSEVTCLRCGQQLINGDDSMMCSDCECEYGDSDSDDYCTCNCCGRRFYYDDAYWIDDEAICPQCAETQSFICDDCGGRYFNDEQYYVEDIGYVCGYCYRHNNNNNKEEC